MKVVDAVAQVLKAEGVEFLFAYPVNPLIDACAKVGIRPVIVRQERIGLHMADALSRVSSGERAGVFAMQHGPGTENAFGGVAQAYGDSVPIMVLPAGYGRNMNQVMPNFHSYLNFQHVTKSLEQLQAPGNVYEVMRRAFTQLKNGRPQPVMVELPTDLMNEDCGDFNYRPAPKFRSGPNPVDVDRIAQALVDAKRPVLYAGQGVHYSKAWKELLEFAELLEAPVTTTIAGKSAFPENHPLYLGAGGRAISRGVHEFLNKSDLIFGIGNSFTKTNFGVQMPAGSRLMQATLDPTDINKSLEVEDGLIGDAQLTLQMLVEAVKERVGNKGRGRKAEVAAEIKQTNDAWLKEWMPKLTSKSTPINPYRVVWDLRNTADAQNTIITHDAGSPREQLSPFWECTEPLSYIGWGKTTQLGAGLGFAMGAKLAKPEKLCVNFWGDAAIGFTGMDFETCAREKIPIMSMVMNNYSMAIELKIMAESTKLYRTTDISGNYADMAKAFGCYGERIEDPAQIVPAIKRGIEKTEEGVPVLLEFMTEKEVSISTF